jgi:hypothetical protein
MYSPKISEKFIPHLYHMAKNRGMRMTALVNEIIGKELKKEEKRISKGDAYDSFQRENRIETASRRGTALAKNLE